MKWLQAIAAAALLAAAVGLGSGHWQVPDRWNPWAPLRLDDPPHLLTRYKLARLSGEPGQCLTVLAGSGFGHQAVPDRHIAPGCALRNAVRIDATALRVSRPFVLSCRAAVSLALWERHTLLPAAERHFGEPVAGLEHWGSYACRNVYGREGGPRSRHATADALDISGFVLRSGRRVQVARHWTGESDAARFLHEVHEGACPFFDAVLGPGYNAAHADHLHLDRGGYRVCR